MDSMFVSAMSPHNMLKVLFNTLYSKETLPSARIMYLQQRMSILDLLTTSGLFLQARELLLRTDRHLISKWFAGDGSRGSPHQKDIHYYHGWNASQVAALLYCSSDLNDAHREELAHAFEFACIEDPAHVKEYAYAENVYEAYLTWKKEKKHTPTGVSPWLGLVYFLHHFKIEPKAEPLQWLQQNQSKMLLKRWQDTCYDTVVMQHYGEIGLSYEQFQQFQRMGFVFSTREVKHIVEDKWSELYRQSIQPKMGFYAGGAVAAYLGFTAVDVATRAALCKAASFAWRHI